MSDSLSVYEVNWKKPLDTLCGLVKSRKGGLVRVFVGEACAPSSFLKVARTRIRGLGVRDLKLDPADETTRTPRDIVFKLEDWLGITTQTPEIRVGCDNTADTVTVEDVNIEVPLPATSRRCRAIARRIRDGLIDSPRAILVWASADVPEMTSRWFWGELWEEHLAPLTAHGLVAIEWARPTSAIPEWAPEAQVEIHLPSVYSAEERAAAESDIALLLQAEGIFDAQESVLHARTMLAAWGNRPGTVYASLSAAIGRLKA